MLPFVVSTHWVFSYCTIEACDILGQGPPCQYGQQSTQEEHYYSRVQQAARKLDKCYTQVDIWGLDFSLKRKTKRHSAWCALTSSPLLAKLFVMISTHTWALTIHASPFSQRTLWICTKQRFKLKFNDRLEFSMKWWTSDREGKIMKGQHPGSFQSLPEGEYLCLLTSIQDVFPARFPLLTIILLQGNVTPNHGCFGVMPSWLQFKLQLLEVLPHF